MAECNAACVPIDTHLSDLVKSTFQSDSLNFTVREWRMKSLTMLVFVVYLWSGEGLSSRNWQILQMVAMIYQTLRVAILHVG